MRKWLASAFIIFLGVATPLDKIIIPCVVYAVLFCSAVLLIHGSGRYDI